MHCLTKATITEEDFKKMFLSYMDNYENLIGEDIIRIQFLEDQIIVEYKTEIA